MVGLNRIFETFILAIDYNMSHGKLAKVTGKLAALKGLDAQLKEIRGYLDLVIDGKLPLNHEILYHLQDVFKLLPNLNVADLIKAFAVKTNYQMLVIYLSSLIRSVIALHNLINNKIIDNKGVLKTKLKEIL
ncbi:hypothetical protein L6452_41264 [Arctium lappa]|uniref:Uncharacterized protein n=1 Tax=Arctium lappa TaxID=4217 RepID=A0ACB8XP88_ARCLA|nr:hypothetical protein L6452_41264 [Arctium lappa]